MVGWKRLGAVAAEDLAEGRLELQHAAQLPALGVGRSLVPPRPDDSHTTLDWLGDAEQWVTGEVAGSGAVRAGLHPADFTLTLTHGSQPPKELQMPGRTLAEALAWLKRGLEDFGVDSQPVSIELPYEIPDHPVASGKAFSATLSPQLAELSRYFSNASLLLEAVAGETPEASPVRTWAHHFDMATLISLDEEGGEEARSIGVGLAPGDEHYPVPYFYVTPWPFPESEGLPALAGGGEWHVKGWTGAVLQASRLTETADADEQERRARDFLASAIEASLSLLG